MRAFSERADTVLSIEAGGAWRESRPIDRERLMHTLL
jgi:hypothetical protein